MRKTTNMPNTQAFIITFIPNSSRYNNHAHAELCHQNPYHDHFQNELHQKQFAYECMKLIQTPK